MGKRCREQRTQQEAETETCTAHMRQESMPKMGSNARFQLDPAHSLWKRPALSAAVALPMHRTMIRLGTCLWDELNFRDPGDSYTSAMPCKQNDKKETPHIERHARTHKR